MFFFIFCALLLTSAFTAEALPCQDDKNFEHLCSEKVCSGQSEGIKNFKMYYCRKTSLATLPTFCQKIQRQYEPELSFNLFHCKRAEASINVATERKRSALLVIKDIALLSNSGLVVTGRTSLQRR
ncbi:hypothetical protein GCK32_001421 [Trichostrongylus colubriformis]|uniref:Uncharacterized protein n=1 Tax=Trichostrongylus colubriformis TaxID=6319 RepID=A0AAN8IK68_TRICO